MRLSGIAALAVCVAGTSLVMAAEKPPLQEKKLRAQLAAHPGDHESRFQLARLLSWQNRFDAALIEYRRLIKAKPDNPDYLLGLAQTLLWNGAPRDALPLLQKARRLSPRYADLWHVEIQALLALPEPQAQQAKNLRDEARRRFPERTWHYPSLEEPAPHQDPPTLRADSTASDTPPQSEPPPEPPPAAPQIQSVQAAAPPPNEAKSKTELEVGTGHDRLSRHLPAWQQQYLNLSWQGADQQRLYGGIREVRRYDQTDRETHLGGVWAFSPAAQLQLEFGTSDTHRILPEHYAAFHAYVRPATGWSLVAGIRQSRYTVAASRVLSLGVDRYIDSERFGYTLFDGGPLGTRPVASHRLQWAHYYSETSWIGLTYLRGQESENVPATGLLTTRVSSYALSGQHALTQHWSLTWNLEQVRQGDLYERSGIQLGLRHAF